MMPGAIGGGCVLSFEYEDRPFEGVCLLHSLTFFKSLGGPPGVKFLKRPLSQRLALNILQKSVFAFKRKQMNPMQSYHGFTKHFFEDCKAAASDLGLSIPSRLKLVPPQREGNH